MTIFDKRKPTTVLFKEIKAGECFIDEEDEVSIKLDISHYDTMKEGFPNAVVLDDGLPWECDDDTPVIKVRASITITE